MEVIQYGDGETKIYHRKTNKKSLSFIRKKVNKDGKIIAYHFSTTRLMALSISGKIENGKSLFIGRSFDFLKIRLR